MCIETFGLSGAFSLNNFVATEHKNWVYKYIFLSCFFHIYLSQETEMLRSENLILVVWIHSIMIEYYD